MKDINKTPADLLYDICFGSIFPDRIKGKVGGMNKYIPTWIKDKFNDLRSKDTWDVRADRLFVGNGPKNTTKVFRLK